MQTKSKKSSDSKAKPVGRSRLGAGLLLLIAVPVTLLVYVGGLQGIADGLASRAVANWNEPAAEKWLAWSDWLGDSSHSSAFLRARLARRDGQLDEMQKLLEKARRLGAPPELLNKEIVLAKTQIGQLDEAESQLSQWLSTGDADSRDICSAYANGLAAAGRISDAMEVLQAWETDYPGDPQPTFRLGRIREHQQDYDAAEKHYMAAIAKDADYLPAKFSLARMLTQRRRIEEAIPYYRDCLRAPNPVAAEVGLAICLKAIGQIEEARTLLTRATQVDAQTLAASYQYFEEMQDRALAAAELGKIETEMGNYAAGVQLLEQALEANPRDNVARFSYATALRGMGRNDEADAEFEKVSVAREELAKATRLTERVAKNPADVEARIELGQIHLNYDSETRGLYWLRTVFSYDPENRQTHQILADYFASQPGEQANQLAAEHRRLAESPSDTTE